MITLPPENLLPLLRCPVSGSPLALKEGLIVSEMTPSRRYRSIDGKPVLVDFSLSVLEEDGLFARAGDSPITRRERAKWGWLRAITEEDKRTTERNIELFISSLKRTTSTPLVLIVGGGSIGKGTKALYADPAIRFVSCDIYSSPHVDVIADAHKLPFADAVFDGVVVQAVLEHVVEPQTVVSEIARVLRVNGLVYAETPFMQPVHEGPYDFTRFTESGHRYLFREFKMICSGACSGAGAYLQWGFEYFVRSVTRSRKLGKMAKLSFFWLPYLDRLIASPFNIDAACGVFFLGSKAETKLTQKEIVAHYKGAQS